MEIECTYPGELKKEEEQRGGSFMETRKVGRTTLKILILIVAMQDNGMGAATPALGAISQAFPEAGYQVVSMIATLPALMLAVMPIFYPKLVQVLRKRSILLLAAALFVIGGVGPAFFSSSIYAILFFRFLLGAACGTFIPMCVDLIVDFFEGDERARMIGWSSAFTGLSGVMFQTLGGWLASMHWSYCFFAYLVSIVLLMFPVLFLPEPPYRERLTSEQQNSGNMRVKTPLSVWVIALFLGLYWMFAYVIITNASTVLLEEGIAVQSQIGLIFSCMTLGTVLSSGLFGILLDKVGYVILPIGMLVGAASMAAAFMAHSIVGFVVAMFLLGLSGGVITPGVAERNMSLVSYAGGTKAVSISYLFLGVGSFVSPFVFGNLGLSARGQMCFAAIAFVVLAIALFFVNRAVEPKAKS